MMMILTAPPSSISRISGARGRLSDVAGSILEPEEERVQFAAQGSLIAPVGHQGRRPRRG
jgi:hypothetical protein